MAGVILALAAVFAVSSAVMSGSALIGALLFPVGVCMLYLLGFDLLTGVFMFMPLAWLDKRPGVTVRGILRNWGLVFVGNFLGAHPGLRAVRADGLVHHLFHHGLPHLERNPGGAGQSDRRPGLHRPDALHHARAPRPSA